MASEHHISDETVMRIAGIAATEALKQVQALSKDQASNIALAAAKEAVRETQTEFFALLGINIANFEDVQRLRTDLEFLRTTRSGAVTAGRHFWIATITLLAGGFLMALWVGIKSAVHR